MYLSKLYVSINLDVCLRMQFNREGKWNSESFEEHFNVYTYLLIANKKNRIYKRDIDEKLCYYMNDYK